ncbi:hypothetical protein B0H67DRAFT_589185 [Lasiosphaeris hirsuta]|uniref:Secreted protein n=1 Tax=Lasiosphaeris hirsuta TaxID=260670 RepID=A0AA40DNV1_9PEZI|nr:hypothetical protein B0H67DRAFT_589185 [Lasiosphaeris hirsuta]
MTKLSTAITGAIAILAMGTSAAPSTAAETVVDKRCTGTTIQAPQDIIIFDITDTPETSGWSTNPLVQIFQYSDNLINYRQVLRFNPPSTGTCTWVMNLPASRYNTHVLQDKPANNAGPVHLSFWGVESTYKPGDKISDVKPKPGPYGVNAVQPGEQIIHSEPCAQIGTDLLVRIPPWDAAVTQSVYWAQDIKPGNPADSLGIYIKVDC